MKSIILYYSYTGNCRNHAMLLKQENEETDIYEVKDKKSAGMITTFMIKCPMAALRKSAKIQKIEVDLNAYDRITVVVPIWNSYPAPEFNSILKELPASKDVELFMCSGSGESAKSKSGTCELIKKIGCNLIGYHDVKTTGMIMKPDQK